MKKLPEWITTRHQRLWQTYANQAFTLSQAREALGQAESQTKNALAKMESHGYLLSEPDPLDLRSRQYRLMSPEVIQWAEKLESEIEQQPDINKPLAAILDELWARVREQILEEFGPLDLPETLAAQVSEVAAQAAKRDTLGLIDRVDFTRFDKAEADELKELLKLFDGKLNSYRSVTNVLLEYMKFRRELDAGEYDAPVADIALLDGQPLVEQKREKNTALCPICRRFPQSLSAQAMITGNPKMDSVFQLYRGARSQIKICSYCFLSGYADLPLARISKDGQSINKQRDYLFVETPIARRALERLLAYLREGGIGELPEQEIEAPAAESAETGETDLLAQLIKGLQKDGIAVTPNDLPILFGSRQRLSHVSGFLLNSVNALSNLVVLRVPLERLSGDEKISGAARQELAKAVMYDFWSITMGTASLHYGSMPARETFTSMVEMNRPLTGRFTIHGSETTVKAMRRANVAYKLAEHSPNPAAPPRFRQHLGRQDTKSGAVLISPLYLLLLSDTRTAVNQMLRRHRRENDNAKQKRILMGEKRIKEVLDMAESIAEQDWKFDLGLEIIKTLVEVKLLFRNRSFWKNPNETRSGYELVKWLQRMKMIRDETSARAWCNQLINALKRGDDTDQEFRRQKGLATPEPNAEVIGKLLKLTEQIIQTCREHRYPLGDFSRNIAEMDYYLLFTYNQSQPKNDPSQTKKENAA